MKKVEVVLILFIIFSLSCFGCNNPQDKSYKSNEIKKELTLEEKISGIYILSHGKKDICELFNLKEEPKGSYFILKLDATENRALGRFLYNDKLYEMQFEKIGELKYNLIYQKNKLVLYLRYVDTYPDDYYYALQLKQYRENSSDREGDRSRFRKTIEEAVQACKEDEKFMKEINEYK